MDYNDIVKKTLKHQLKNFFLDVNDECILEFVPQALQEVVNNYSVTKDSRVKKHNKFIFSPYISILWMNFLYRLSHILYQNGNISEADQVYYCNKILHGNDWFYGVDLPAHFFVEHPLGSVLGRARYGDYFMIYQGTTVGGNRKGDGKLYYPTVGNYVILFANATVLGDSHIGNNVLVSADTYIINETIPNNSIVFGRSPNLMIKKMNESMIKKRICDFMQI